MRKELHIPNLAFHAIQHGWLRILKKKSIFNVFAEIAMLSSAPHFNEPLLDADVENANKINCIRCLVEYFKGEEEKKRGKASVWQTPKGRKKMIKVREMNLQSCEGDDKGNKYKFWDIPILCAWL